MRPKYFPSESPRLQRSSLEPLEKDPSMGIASDNELRSVPFLTREMAKSRSKMPAPKSAYLYGRQYASIVPTDARECGSLSLSIERRRAGLCQLDNIAIRTKKNMVFHCIEHIDAEHKNSRWRDRWRC